MGFQINKLIDFNNFSNPFYTACSTCNNKWGNSCEISRAKIDGIIDSFIIGVSYYFNKKLSVSYSFNPSFTIVFHGGDNHIYDVYSINSLNVNYLLFNKSNEK